MRNKTFIIIVVAILLCIVALLTARVLAKYISVLQATGEAQVAKWSFQKSLKNNGQSVTNSQIQLQNTYNKETLANGKIAPGTSGNFSIEIDGTGSEVGIEYTVVFKEKEGKEEKPSNLRFSLDGGKTYVNSIHDLEKNLQGTMKANETNKVKEIQILWDWPYETGEISQNDPIDTQEAASIQNYAFDIVITGTQVNPQ